MNLDNNLYEVESILRFRKKKNRKEYLIKWSGWTKEHNTWEPEENLANVQQLISEFHDKEHNKKKKGRKAKNSQKAKELTDKVIASLDHNQTSGKSRVSFCQEVQEEQNDQKPPEKEQDSQREEDSLEAEPESEQDLGREQEAKSQNEYAVPDLEYNGRRDISYYNECFSRLNSSASQGMHNNNVAMRFLRSQVPVEYMISYYQQTHQDQQAYEQEDSNQIHENFLQSPMVISILRQLMQITDQDVHDIA